MNIGHLMQDARKEKNYTVEAMALIAETSPGTYRAYEQSRRVPSAPVFKRICDELNFGGEWVSTTTWVDPHGNTHEFAPCAGGHKRKPPKNEGRKSSLDVSDDDLRLRIIQRILNVEETQTLTAIYHLLGESG